MSEELGPRVVATGWGDHGRLGILDESQHTAFVVNEALLDLKVMPHEVACGDRHSLVLTTRGTVYAFGDGEQGQLGLGEGPMTARSLDDRRRTMATEVEAEELGFVSHVYATHTASFAVSGKGQVFSWGENLRGQLGQGDRVPRGLPILVDTFADRRIKQLACGNHHVLALTGSGQVFSWGMGVRGQLGHKGARADKLKPVMVDTLRGARVVHVGAGRHFSLCVATTKAKHILGDRFHKGRKTQDQRVVLGWGDNECGQLGMGNRDGPVEVPTLNVAMMLVLQDRSRGAGANLVSRVFCGAFHTIMLQENSTLYACGGNKYGQLGNGSLWDVLTPKALKNVANVTEVATGDRHTLLVTSHGILFASGFDHWGELGQGHGKISMVFKAVRPLKGTRVLSCAAGPRHSLCVVTDDVDMAAAQFIAMVKSPDMILRPADEDSAEAAAAAAAATAEGVASGGVEESKRGGEGKRPRSATAGKDRLPPRPGTAASAAGSSAKGGTKDDPGETMEQIPLRTVMRQSASDGFSLTVLAHPPVRSGKYRWNVQMDRLASEYLSAIGVSYANVEPLYDPEHQGDGVTWLYMSDGSALTSGYMEPYALDWGWGDTIGVEVDYNIGTIRFFVNDRDQGVAFYETFDGRPLYLFVGLTGEGDTATLLPNENDEDSKDDVFGESDDAMLCGNIALGSRRALPLEVFFSCRACGLKSVCRSCAYTCHLGHCVELIVNYGNLTCECGVPQPNPKTGHRCYCLPEDTYAESNSSDEREEAELRELEEEVRDLKEAVSPTHGGRDQKASERPQILDLTGVR